MIRKVTKSKLTKRHLRSWKLSGRLLPTKSLILTTKSNLSKMQFKTFKRPLKKFMISSETQIIPNYWNKQLNSNNKFMPFGTKLNNSKNSKKPKLTNGNKNNKRLSTSNGPRTSRLKRQRHGSWRNNRERKPNLEKRREQRKTRNLPKMEKRNQVINKHRLNQHSKELRSIETKRKLMHVPSWYSIARTWM